jgi:replicative DNA helicase
LLNPNGHKSNGADRRRGLLDQLPPHSIEAEVSVLGSIILAGTENIHAIGEAVAVLAGPSDFFLPKHAVIYENILKLYEGSKAVDLVVLPQQLKDQGVYEQCGGVDYLIELAESVPTPLHAGHYARIVRDMARRRRLQELCAKAYAEAADGAAPVDESVDRVQAIFFEMCSQAAVRREPVTMAVLMQEKMDAMQAQHEGVGMGLASGIHVLDDATHGFQPGELTIVAARPSMGKSAFATTVAEFLGVENGRPVALFSLEMNKPQLANRFLAAVSDVDSRRIQRNDLNGPEVQRIEEAAGRLSAAPIYIDDTPAISITQLRSTARALVAKHGVCCVFVDYLQLVTSPGSESRQIEVGSISRGLKALAREIHVPVVALSQVNREVTSRASKRPMLSDLRESGSLEQDADVVVMLHREGYYREQDDDAVGGPDDNVVELILAKNRQGPTGILKALWCPQITKFRNLHAQGRLL